MRALYIIGAGGLGRETAVLVERINASSSSTWQLKGFVDDDSSLHHQEILSYPVMGDVDWLTRQSDAAYVLAVGTPATRKHIAKRLNEDACIPSPLIDPALFLPPLVSIGAGCLLYRGAVVMTAAQLGRSVVVDANATVGHNVSLGDYVTVHPGANISGNASIGSGVQLGAGSVVLPGVSIGNDAIVGAGAVVNRDLPPNCTAVGVPARPLNHS